MLILYWIDKVSSIVKTVNFDVVSNETHDAAMAITQHPVEDGGDVTDNARPEPRKLSVEGYVSNKPLFSNLFANPLNAAEQIKLLGFQATQLDLPKKQGGAPIFTPGGLTSAVTSAIGSLINGAEASKAFVLRSGGDFPNRALKVYELLEEAREKRALISAITKFGTIDNMLIAKNTIPRTTEDGNGASFQVELQQIKIVKSETVTAPVPAEARGAVAESKGSKNTSKAGDKGKAQLKSALASTMDAGEGAFGAVAKLAGGRP